MPTRYQNEYDHITYAIVHMGYNRNMWKLEFILYINVIQISAMEWTHISLAHDVM